MLSSIQLRCLCAVCLFVVLFVPKAGADDKMVFRTEPPDPKFVMVTGNAWTIYAESIIDKDAALRRKSLP